MELLVSQENKLLLAWKKKNPKKKKKINKQFPLL